MWTLFTRALALSPSTIHAQTINTSANFLITAVLGLLIFAETLPPLWLLGAAFLVAGSVIISRRKVPEIDGKAVDDTSGEGEPLASVTLDRDQAQIYRDEVELSARGRADTEAVDGAAAGVRMRSPQSKSPT